MPDRVLLNGPMRSKLWAKLAIRAFLPPYILGLTMKYDWCMQLRPVEDVLRELRLRDFGMEIGVISFLALYIVTMLVGSRANKRLAERWCSVYGIGSGILAQQFAYVGVGAHHAWTTLAC